MNASYRAELQRYISGRGWVKWGNATSKKYEANGNYDHECFGPFSANRTWRIKFYKTTVYGGAYGDYWIWGYKHD